MRDVNAGRVPDRSVERNAAANPNQSGNRFLIPIPLQAIWGYGCWCHFGEDTMKGQGTPVNMLDGFCKSMQLCLRCAVLDGQNCPQDEDSDQDKICDPKNQGYNSEFKKFWNKNLSFQIVQVQILIICAQKMYV